MAPVYTLEFYKKWGRIGGKKGGRACGACKVRSHEDCVKAGKASAAARRLMRLAEEDPLATARRVFASAFPKTR